MKVFRDAAAEKLLLAEEELEALLECFLAKLPLVLKTKLNQLALCTQKSFF